MQRRSENLEKRGGKSRDGSEACRYLGVESYARNEPRIINKERKVEGKRGQGRATRKERKKRERVGPFWEAGSKSVKERRGGRINGGGGTEREKGRKREEEKEEKRRGRERGQQPSLVTRGAYSGKRFSRRRSLKV